MHICTYAYIRMYIYACIYVHMHTSENSYHLYVYIVCVHICMHICTYAYIRMCHAHKHTHTHTHPHLQMRPRQCPLCQQFFERKDRFLVKGTIRLKKIYIYIYIYAEEDIYIYIYIYMAQSRLRWSLNPGGETFPCGEAWAQIYV